jgi:hypothetical protein
MQEAVTALFKSAQDGGRSERLSVARSEQTLREQLRQTLRHSHYSSRTNHTHAMWDKRLILVDNVTQPDGMKKPELNAALSFCTWVICRVYFADDHQSRRHERPFR